LKWFGGLVVVLEGFEDGGFLKCSRKSGDLWRSKGWNLRNWAQISRSGWPEYILILTSGPKTLHQQKHTSH